MQSHRLPYIAAGLLIVLAATVFAANTIRTQLVRKKVEQVKGDFKQITSAAVNYGIDRCGYYNPPDTSWRRIGEPEQRLTFETALDYHRLNPGLPDRRPNIIDDPITSPIAYLDSLRPDPFRLNGSYGYFTVAYRLGRPEFAILQSPGPDGRDDVDLVSLREAFYQHGGLLETHSICAVRRLVSESMISQMYDPTNGIISRGDIIGIIWRDGLEYSSFGINAEWARPCLLEIENSIAQNFAPARSQPSTQDGILPADSSPNETMIPLQLVELWKEYGIDIEDPDFFHRSATMQSAANRLGHAFPDLYANPTDQMRVDSDVYRELTNEAPDWWAMIARFKFSADAPAVAVKRDRLNILLPLFGKSIIADAAANSSLQHFKAVEELIRLQSLLEMIYLDFEPVAGSQDERIKVELSRLTNQMLVKLGYDTESLPSQSN